MPPDSRVEVIPCGYFFTISPEGVIYMANHTERIGVHHCAEIAEANNWLFREQPVNDIGIDAHMEYVESLGRANSFC